MTVTLVQVVEALGETLTTIDGFRVHDHIPGSTEFPAAFIVPPEIDYRQAMKTGFIRMELEVIVLVSAVMDRTQKDLFRYLDWSGVASIVKTVDDDPTLGLTGINAVPMSSRPLGLEEVASYQAWGAAVRFLIGSTT